MASPNDSIQIVKEIPGKKTFPTPLNNRPIKEEFDMIEHLINDTSDEEEESSHNKAKSSKQIPSKMVNDPR